MGWPTVILPVLFGIFFLFVAGEEISWGQRIFGLETPEVLQNHNVQGELNLHNLSIFDKHGGILNQHTALNVFALLIGVVIPLVYLTQRRLRQLLNWLHFPVLPASLVLFFLGGLLYGQSLAKLYPHWAHTEIKELIFATGFLLFAISVTRKQNILRSD